MVLFKIKNTISHSIFVISTNFFQVSTPLGVLFPTHYKNMHTKNFKSGVKHDVISVTSHIKHLLTFFMKNHWQLVFLLFTKFGVERVNIFQVIRNNAKYPRNRETFGGWFGPYVMVDISRPWLTVSGISIWKWRTRTMAVRENVFPAIF